MTPLSSVDLDAKSGAADAHARLERAYRPTIFAIAAMVLAILVGETLYGWSIGSRFLIRDGLEWIYDVLIYCFSALAFGRGAAMVGAGVGRDARGGGR